MAVRVAWSLPRVADVQQPAQDESLLSRLRRDIEAGASRAIAHTPEQSADHGGVNVGRDAQDVYTGAGRRSEWIAGRARHARKGGTQPMTTEPRHLMLIRPDATLLIGALVP